MSTLAVDAGSGTRSSPVTARDPAADVVARATDPRSGQLDTERLAGWVVDARRSDPQQAEVAHAAIEQQLLASGRLTELGHYHQDVQQAAARDGMLPDAVPNGLWAAGQTWVQQGGQVLRDNPILVKRWESTTSAWTGKGGFTHLLYRPDGRQGESYGAARGCRCRPAAAVSTLPCCWPCDHSTKHHHHQPPTVLHLQGMATAARASSSSSSRRPAAAGGATGQAPGTARRRAAHSASSSGIACQGLAMRSRSTRSKWRGSCAFSSEASRGRCRS